MLPQRALVRSAQRLSQRAPARLPKRHSSTQHSFTGAEDNAFNRERAAVKQHAAESSEERPQYEYMNIRNKLYPWGDGNKTLFWNDKVNYRKEE
ncbi:cytochrome c oxidase subunit VIa [Venturia nashicola]|uniref:Cytochrome c oxidase subunit n=1 Tax=Venturia nashicola TaxID=86259 RepID=A0A4Z1P6X3_9PEZI|nr:cytochrome c oxidase subunit VIa [Venturia nashicola]